MQSCYDAHDMHSYIVSMPQYDHIALLDVDIVWWEVDRGLTLNKPLPTPTLYT